MLLKDKFRDDETQLSGKFSLLNVIRIETLSNWICGLRVEVACNIGGNTLHACSCFKMPSYIRNTLNRDRIILGKQTIKSIQRH